MKPFIVILFVSLIALTSATRDTSLIIINGEKAELGQFPHQVSLVTKSTNFHFCGGTILSSRWILTAAHCYSRAVTSSAVVGSINLKSGGEAYNISKVILHPNGSRNDIALLRTAEEIKFNEYVQPANLPTEDTLADVALIVSGWGYISYYPNDVESSEYLHFLNTKSISVEECKERFKGIGSILETHDMKKLVCAFTINAGACLGDSGGPLTAANRTVVGIVNFGIPCARNYPDGYARVYSYLDFIKKTMGTEYDD